MDLREVKQYIRVDYTDDDELIELMIDAAEEELKELIPSYDPESPTNRQKLLIMAYVQEMYDKRGNTFMEQKEKGYEKLRYAIRSLLLKEMLR